MNDNLSNKLNKVELLSPAGDYECFKSAVSAGCDAVYLSGSNYGARAYAKNFSDDEVIKAIETAHLYGVKVYLTVNTLLKNNELNELGDYINPFYKAGLDSVIVQDMGVISYINKYFPNLNVHASTQLAITSVEGIKLLSKLGVKRTVLARELSLAEIKDIRDNDDMELECFVHGALCYSYSGKCLFSSLIGGRSGNRGRCAGSCRQPYNEKYVLSTKDICCLSILPELISAGINSFKIEGRMKSAGYVYGVTSLYRKYIDLYYSCGAYGDIEYDLSTLERLYTRGGNSNGYYFEYNGRDMISLEDASYKRDINIDSDSPDNIVIPPLETLKISGKISVRIGENLKLSLSYGNYDIEVLGNVVEKAGNRPIDEATVKKQLFKTGDTAFEFNELECDLSDDAFVRIGELNEIRREGLTKLKNKILENTKRMPENENGDPTSVCQHIVVAEQHEHNIRGDNANTCQYIVADMPSGHNIPGDFANTCQYIVSTDRVGHYICADVCTYDQLKVCLENKKIRRIIIPFSFLDDASNVSDGSINSKNKAQTVPSIENIINQIKNAGKEVYIKFQSVIRNSFLKDNADKILNALKKSDGALIDNNELLYFLNENGFDKPVVADIHMYNFNDTAYETYRNLGISRFTVPIELNRRELLERTHPGEELIIYGYLPMMVSSQCVNNTLYGCDKTEKQIRLKDRKNASFICVNDCTTCTNYIYNSVPLSLHGEGELINALKPAALKINLTIEDKAESERIIEYFTNDEHDSLNPPYKNFTKGHINRGVL